MPLPQLPTPPSRNDPSNFSDRADDFLGALPAWGDAANALEQSLQLVATTGTSTTSVSMGTGARSFNTQTGKAWAVGAFLYLVNSADPTKFMVGQVTAYNSGTGLLSVNVSTVMGSGGYDTWAIGLAVPDAAAQNVSGGNAGTLLYQSSANVTAHLAAGSVGQVLLCNGGAAPAWTTPPFLRNAVNIWNNDEDGNQRVYFERLVGGASATYIKGFGPVILKVQNPSGAQVFSVTSDGRAQNSIDGTAPLDLTTLQQVQGLIAASAFGFGQTYQNLIGSRTNGVTYTNSTSKPIVVIAGGISSGGSPQQGVISGFVDGVEVIYTSPFSNAGNYVHTISFIVPAGSTYAVGLSNLFINRWFEFR